MITLNPYDFTHALAMLCSIDGDEDSSPVLRLETAQGRLYLYCSSPLVRLRADIAAEGELPDNQPVGGRGELLKRAAWALCGDGTALRLSVSDTGVLVLNKGGNKICLRNVGGSHLPEIHDWPDDAQGEPVECSPRLLSDLYTVLRVTDEKFCSDELAFLRLSPCSGKLIAEALNDHEYRRVSLDAPSWAALLPEQGIQIAAESIRQTRHIFEHWSFRHVPRAILREQELVLSVPGLNLSVPLMNRVWPDTDKFRAKAAGGATVITCRGDDLKDALRVMDVVSDADARAVLLTPSDNGIVLRGGNSTRGRAKSEIPGDWTFTDAEGPALVERIAFPCKQMRDWLRDLPGAADLSIRPSGPEGPALFTCAEHPEYEAIIMPMKVADSDWFGGSVMPVYASALGSLYQGHSVDVLRRLPSGAARCCVTSPPYWGLRDYGVAGQIGLESTPEAYTDRLCEVFAELWRVLADDGTLWLNLGDSYSSNVTKRGVWDPAGSKQAANPGSLTAPSRVVASLGPKQLVGIPWRMAFALQDMGWILRSEIIWHKPNPMPESVRDRPTSAHEHLFLFSKRTRYYYDADAVREPAAATNAHDYTGTGYAAPGQPPHAGNRSRLQSPQALSFARSVREPDRPGQEYAQHRPERTPRPGIDTRGGNQGTSGIPDENYTRNMRDVWTIPTHPYAEAHFATFPPRLVRPCILAGSGPGETVIDPFFGSGTTGLVARALGRRWIGIDLNPDYCALALKRINVHEPRLTDILMGSV